MRKGKFGPDGLAATTTAEQNFWRTVSDAEEHFVALKGAESTKTHGSGFPAYEPRYIAQSDWNLTNLRNLPDGVMGFLPDVDTITTPKLEFSSLFSASGWHVQPHFLPLISYNHLGNVRVWYVSPDSEKVLSALQEVAPRIGGGVRHVIDPNSVIIPPSEMIARDIRVCRAVQKPGEFIITAAKSYTASFNLGLNVVESVNFAAEKWLNCTVDSVRLYQGHRLRPPVNIPGLVCDVMKRQDTLSEKMLREAEPCLTALLLEELDLRKEGKLQRLSPAGSGVGKTRYCATCHTICHFSYATSKAKDAPTYCLTHAGSATTMYCLHSDGDLRELLDRLEKRLHPKRSIVHPVQALARSVSRPNPTPTTPTTRTSTPASVCPASPAEEEAVRENKGGLDLQQVTQPSQLQDHPLAPPIQVSGAIQPNSPVFITSTSASVFGPTLARPIPIKPAPINPLKLLPSLLVHPQQQLIPSGAAAAAAAAAVAAARSAGITPPAALWECYQP